MMTGCPLNLCPVMAIARPTEISFVNSTYAIPFERLEFLSEIIRTSSTYKYESRNTWNIYCPLWVLTEVILYILYPSLGRRRHGCTRCSGQFSFCMKGECGGLLVYSCRLLVHPLYPLLRRVAGAPASALINRQVNFRRRALV